MTNKQKQRLEKNLSLSAAGARINWIRALTGTSPEQQGFINPKILPINETTLGEFYEDFKAYVLITNETIEELKAEIGTLNNSIELLESKVQDQDERIKELEGFALD